MKIDTALSRTRVARDHALITPESHVPAPLVGWEKSQAITLIAPVMGAGFTQHLVTMEAGAASADAAASQAIAAWASEMSAAAAALVWEAPPPRPPEPCRPETAGGPVRRTAKTGSP